MSSLKPCSVLSDQVTEPEIKELIAFIERLPVGSSMRAFAQNSLDSIQCGEGITALPHGRELTPNEAAKALNMSRPHLLNFLRSGELKYHLVGTHKRIAYKDFLDFKMRHEKASQDVAKALATNSTSPQVTLSEEEMEELDQL